MGHDLEEEGWGREGGLGPRFLGGAFQVEGTAPPQLLGVEKQHSALARAAVGEHWGALGWGALVGQGSKQGHGSEGDRSHKVKHTQKNHCIEIIQRADGAPAAPAAPAAIPSPPRLCHTLGFSGLMPAVPSSQPWLPVHTARHPGWPRGGTWPCPACDTIVPLRS